MSARLIAEKPNRQLTMLHNGVKVATWQDARFGNNVAFSIQIESGALQDPPHLPGLTHFTEHVIVDTDLDRHIALQGGDTNASTGLYSTRFEALVSGNDLGGTFWRMAQSMKNPSLGSVQIDRERKRILAEQKERSFVPNDLALNRATLGLPPEGQLVAGTVEAVSQITADDIRARWRMMFEPQKLTIAMAGNVNHAEVVALAENAFGALHAGPEMPVIHPPFNPAFISKHPHAERGDLVVFFKSLDAEHPLAQHVPNLRYFMAEHPELSLKANLSDRLGLTYSAYGFVFSRPNYWTASLECSFDSVESEKVVSAMDDATFNLADRLTEAHMQQMRARGQLVAETGTFSLSNMRNELLTAAQTKTLPLSPTEQFELNATCSLADMQTIARATFSSKPAIAIVGGGDQAGILYKLHSVMPN